MVNNFLEEIEYLKLDNLLLICVMSYADTRAGILSLICIVCLLNNRKD